MTTPNETHPANLPNPARLFLQEGLLVAWVPVAFYFLTYCYERSYVSALGVPTAFVQVGPQQMIDFIFSLTVCWWLLIALVGFFIESKGIPEEISPAKWSYFFMIFFALILIAINGSFISKQTLLYVVIILAMAALDFLLSRLSTDKKMKGFFAFVLDEKLKADPSQRPVEYFLYKLVFVTGVGFILATNAGQHAAKSQTQFTVSTDDNTLILVYYEENKAVCASYDPFTHRVGKGAVLVPISEKGRTKFINVNLGQLDFKATLGS